MTKHQLKNGLTVLLDPIPHVRSATIAVYIKGGSVTEQSDKQGVAHFVEHMLFKGTSTRTAKDIAMAIEGKGGYLNAFTSKDETCYHASVIDTEIYSVLDILSDIYKNSLFAEEDVELERAVIVEEILKEHDDSEYLSQLLFLNSMREGTPYAGDIAGTVESVKTITPYDLKKHMATTYTAPNTIISVAGNFDSKAILKYIDKCFSDLSSAEAPSIPEVIKTAQIGHVTQRANVGQMYFCMGYDSHNARHTNRRDASVLNTALGGEMYSRLFQQIRESRGLAYSIESNNFMNIPCGTLMITGIINPKNWDTVLDIILNEIQDISKNGLTTDELELAKNTLIGKYVLHGESPSERCYQMATYEMIYGREITVDEYMRDVNAVTNTRIIDYVNCYLKPHLASYAFVTPKGNLFSRLFDKWA